jgi:hypothetical protein
MNSGIALQQFVTSPVNRIQSRPPIVYNVSPYSFPSTKSVSQP